MNYNDCSFLSRRKPQHCLHPTDTTYYWITSSVTKLTRPIDGSELNTNKTVASRKSDSARIKYWRCCKHDCSCPTGPDFWVWQPFSTMSSSRKCRSMRCYMLQSSCWNKAVKFDRTISMCVRDGTIVRFATLVDGVLQPMAYWHSSLPFVIMFPLCDDNNNRYRV